MIEYIAEFCGTFILVLLGNGVVANVSLNKTKGQKSGWIVIAAGWGMAVFVAVLVAGPISGAHINPAVTLGLAVSGLFEWIQVLPFIIAQLLGGLAGAYMVYLFYYDHFKITENQDAIMGCFCTSPENRNKKRNFLSELVGTFILVFAVLFITIPGVDIEGIVNVKVGLGSLDALPVGLIVLAIGLSLGGTTGYAINPARDLSPRIIHSLIPLKGKRDSDWSYSWVPIAGPFSGAAVAALCYFFILWIQG